MVGLHDIEKGLGKGLCYRRRAWPEGAFIYLTREKNVDIRDWTAPLTEEDQRRGYIRIFSHIDMHEPDGHRCIGYGFDTEDLDADDWEEVEVD